jgi:two-component system, OmpR family, copper resistance phosphate regulon response regulator CusR
MRILMVDDDPRITTVVKMGLEDHNCMVDIAEESEQAERLLLETKYDVILLDIIMPGISGFELCRKIRSHNIKTPVLMLTTLDSVDDKVEGFESGADDYLVKPFNFQELSARIKALDRRHRETTNHPCIQVADLELDYSAKTVKRASKEIKLTVTEFRLLELLMKNKDKVLDRMEITEQVWGFAFDTGTNVIDVHISSLRSKIDKDFAQKLIHTSVGRGYVMKECK